MMRKIYQRKEAINMPLGFLINEKYMLNKNSNNKNLSNEDVAKIVSENGDHSSCVISCLCP